MRLLLVLFLLITTSSIGQSNFESPYVYKNEAIQVTMPAGYLEFNAPYSGIRNTIFTPDTSAAYLQDLDDAPRDIFLVSHQKARDEMSLEKLVLDGLEDDPNAEVLQAASTMVVNSNNVVTAVVKVSGGDLEIEAIHVAGVQFGEAVVIVAYLSAKPYDVTSAETKNFQEVVQSIQIVKTKKENQVTFDYELSEEDFEFFENSFFETELGYDDIFFDDEDDHLGWSEFWDDDNIDRFLIAYKYEALDEEGSWNEHGKVKVFSGGSIANFPSSNEMIHAIDTVLPRHMIRSLTIESALSSEEYSFTKYSFGVATKGPTRVHSIYTSEIEGELVFFIVEKTEHSDDNFEKAIEDFILSLWVMDEELMYEELEIDPED